MKQVIYGGFWDLIQGGNPSPTYAVFKGSEWTATEPGSDYIVSTAGDLRKFRVLLVDAAGAPVSPGLGTSYTFTVRVNSVDTALSVTIADLATGGNDLVHELALSAGENISLQASWVGPPVDCYARWVTEFQGVNTMENIIIGGGGPCNRLGTRYNGFTIHASEAVEANIYQLIGSTGTLRNFYFHSDIAPSPGQPAQGYQITVRINGVPTALTCFIGGDDTLASDLVNTVAVNAGDIVTIQSAPVGPPANSIVGYIGITFIDSLVNGNGMLANGDDSALNVAATRYEYLTWNMLGGWVANEFQRQQLSLATQLESLYVRVINAPGIGRSWTFTVRVNGVNTALAVTIAGLNTTGSNIVNQVSIADGDYVDIQCTPAGAPAATSAAWGLVSLIAIALPVVITDPATGATGVAANLNGTLDDDGGEACDCGFEWGETLAYGNTTPTQSRNGGQTFQQAIAGLLPNQTYHFRAFATNATGTSYGADRTFATLIILPTVTTNPATSIAVDHSTLNGTLDNDGGEACDCGFQWGETPALGNTTPTQSKNTGDTFSQGISNLLPGRIYYFKAFAINSAGTGYGATRSFTTKTVGVDASVKTLPATLITEHTARINGVVQNDADHWGYVRFQWGGTREYGAQTPWLGGYETGDEFYADLSNLTEGAGYHFRAQFKNSGIVSGQDRVFNTLVPLGPVTLITEDLVHLLEGSL